MINFDSNMQILPVTEEMNICKNSCSAKNCKNVSILVSMLSKRQPYVLLKRLDIDRPIAKVIIGEDTELFTVTHDAANNLKDRLLKRRHVNRFDRKLSAGCTFLKPKSYTQKKIHHVPSVTKTEAI